MGRKMRGNPRIGRWKNEGFESEMIGNGKFFMRKRGLALTMKKREWREVRNRELMEWE